MATMNFRTEDPYADLRPIAGEARYVEYDEEFECWGIFGETSGFCYAQYSCEEDANENL